MPFDIETYVKDYLDKPRKAGGDNYQATCPFCGKAQHFYINVENGRWCCFKCDQRGRNVAAVIAHVEGITVEQARSAMLRRAVQFRRKDTLETLNERIRALRPDAERDDDVAPTDFDLPPEFIPVYKDGRWRMPTYLKERGIKKATAKAWGMGFCNGGRYGGRVVIPVICPNGRSFTARDTTGEQEPRYLNPKEANHGRLLCGWNVIDHDKGDIVLVEGPMDAIKMWQHGFPALALMGKELHRDQLLLLTDRYTKDTAVTILLDPEEKIQPYKVGVRLLIHFDHIYIARLPLGIDPGKSTQAQAQRALDDARRFRGEMGAALGGRLSKSKNRLSGIYQ